jgi:uroporphyrinogen-III synthase
MTETIQGDVLHVIPPDELGEHDLEPALEELAESRYVLVLRQGGHPSVLDLLLAFLRRNPIEVVTVVTDRRVEEEDEVTLTVEETDMEGVYVAGSTGPDTST